MEGADYANGSVHALIEGTAELRTVLNSAAARRQLVVLDFSASWCGPCRMMVPVLNQLAAEHAGRVAFVKVDCEETPRNRELAAEAGIRAFPTFHVYRAHQRVAEFQGANQAALRQAIAQQLPLLGAAPAAPSAAAAGGAPGPMATALAQALGRVRSSCSFDEFVAAARTLLTFVANVLSHPGDPKYRRIRQSNAAFQSKLGSKPGGKECMAALGFRELVEGDEVVLVMGDIPSELGQVKALLEQAIPGGSGASGPSSSGAAGAAASSAGASTASSGGGATAGAPAAAPVAAAPAGAGGGGGAQGAAGAGAGAPVDPAALARALAATMSRMGAGQGAGTAPATGTAAQGGRGAGLAAPRLGAGPAAGGRGPHRVATPAMLARMLEKMLLEGGFGQAQRGQGGGQ